MARSFAGTSSQYLLSTAFASGAFPLTVACNFRTSVVASSSFQRVFTWQNSGSDVISSAIINYPSAGDIANQVYKGGTNALPHKSGVIANTWHHVAAISKSTSNTIYLDGAQGSSQSYTDPGFTGMTYLYVGTTSGPTQYLSGQIAELGVWSVELTAAEIGALADGHTPLEIRPNALIAYYPFGGHYGNYDLDRWKNKYDLTPTNSPTWAEHPRVIYPAFGGTWPLTPQTAAPQAYELICDPASVSVAGQSVSLLVNRTLTASPAQVAVSGQSATLTASRVLTANPASVSVTGQSAGLRADRTLAASPAAVQVAGQSATLTVNRVLTCQPATVQVSGQQATLYKGLAPLVGDAAQVAVNGQAATLRVDRLLVCVGAAIQVAGQLATLTYSGSSTDIDYSVTARTESIARRLGTEARAARGRTEAMARRLKTEAR